MRIFVIITFLVFTIIGSCYSNNSFAKDLTSTTTKNNHVDDIGIGKIAYRLYENCENNIDLIKCLKAQLTKLLGRAYKVQQIQLLDGLSLTKRLSGMASNSDSRSSSSANYDNDTLTSKNLDEIFHKRLIKFLESHQIQVNIPKLLSYGQKNLNDLLFYDDSNDHNDEVNSRKKKDKKFLGPFIAAVLLKAGILKIAYHSIAIVAGKALIVGKIALIISAIIGLKKLVSNDGHEKTTYEIVKHPHVQQSHTYSSSHSGDYDGEGGGSYHRSLLSSGPEEEAMMQDKAYRAHYPKK